MRDYMKCANRGTRIEPFNNKNGTCGADYCETKTTPTPPTSVSANGRELKFRAWDKEHKKIVDDITPSTVAFYGSLNKCFQNTTLMQYTGLKANGKEIYEGDIIENDSEWWTVVFDEGKFQCDPIQGGNVWMDLSEIADSQETWVQGNIYTNPELLTTNNTD